MKCSNSWKKGLSLPLSARFLTGRDSKTPIAIWKIASILARLWCVSQQQIKSGISLRTNKKRGSLMTSQEILRALRAGKISLEEAKEALTSIETGQALVPDILNVVNGRGPVPTLPVQQPSPPQSSRKEAIGTGLAPVPTALGRNRAIAIVGMSGKDRKSVV